MVISASSIVSRETTTASGWSSDGAISSSSLSGYGCSQGTSANDRKLPHAPRPAPDVQLAAMTLGAAGEVLPGHAPRSLHPRSWSTQVLPSGSLKSAKEP